MTKVVKHSSLGLQWKEPTYHSEKDYQAKEKEVIFSGRLLALEDLYINIVNETLIALDLL